MSDVFGTLLICLICWERSDHDKDRIGTNENAQVGHVNHHGERLLLGQEAGDEGNDNVGGL